MYFFLYLFMCRKLVDTPFPFPWAQAMSVLLTFCIVTPVVIVGHITAIWTSMWITWAALQTHIMLNEVRPSDLCFLQPKRM